MILTKLQVNAIEKFKDKNFGALFMKVGTGKTITGLELVKSKQDCDFLIYVTFNTLKTQVEKEILESKINIKNDVVSYESIAMSDKSYLNLLEKLSNYKNVFIISDESTALKNNSKTTNRMLEIRKLCKYALIMTGTPITNDEMDLYNQFQFLSPKILKMNETDFVRNFYEKITYKKKGQREKSFYTFSEINKEFLQKIIDAVSIQGKLDIDFDIKEYVHEVEPDANTLNEFSDKKQDFLNLIMSGESEDSDYMNFLTFANKHFSLDANKNKAVAERTKGKSVIVFSAFRDEQSQIAKNIGRNFFIMNGSTSIEEREEIKQKFYNSKNTPLLITYGVGGRGLNLQSTNEIIFSSVLFDWEKIEQARGRIARIGQNSNELKYNYILTKSNIVKMIQENLGNKDKIVKLVKEAVDKNAENLF